MKYEILRYSKGVSETPFYIMLFAFAALLFLGGGSSALAGLGWSVFMLPSCFMLLSSPPVFRRGKFGSSRTGVV